MLNVVETLLEIVHGIIFLMILIPFVFNNRIILLAYFYFLLSIYIGWIVFNGRCWLSMLESKYGDDKIMDDNGNTLQYRLKKYFNLELSEKTVQIIYWLVNYLAILVLCYKLNRLTFGIIWIVVWTLFDQKYLKPLKINKL
jgi:hypothetical protein